MKYDIVEKQSYALVKAIKEFRSYLVGLEVIVYVPNAIVKDVFVQFEVACHRYKWINRIQEFDIEFQITKLVRGQRLAILMAKTNIKAAQVCNLNDEDNMITSIEHTPWYTDIVYYLKHMKCPKGFNDNKKRMLKLQASKYVFMKGDLYWKNRDGVLLLCLDENQARFVLKEMHEVVCGGHFSAKTTTHKVLRVGYYWPRFFNDAYDYTRKCEAYQKFSGKLNYQGALPLRPLQVEAPFHQWGIDFIGEIAEKSSGGHRWIVVATNYFTKWVEVIPTKQETSRL